jgi:hypothetical protein
VFQQKIHLINHLRRKKPCNNSLDRESYINELYPKNYIDENVCEFCSQRFSSRQKMNYHITNLVCQRRIDIVREKEVNRILKEKLTEKEADIERMKAELKEKDTDIERVKEELAKKPIASTSIVNNGTINNNNIVINAFSFDSGPSPEATRVLYSKDFHEFINQCIPKRIHGLCDVITREHFDPRHKASQNVRLKDIDCDLEVFNGTEWVEEEDSKVMEKILHDAFYLINKYLESKGSLAKITDERITEFIRQVCIPLYGHVHEYPISSKEHEKKSISVEKTRIILENFIKHHLCLQTMNTHYNIKE